MKRCHVATLVTFFGIISVPALAEIPVRSFVTSKAFHNENADFQRGDIVECANYGSWDGKLWAGKIIEVRDEEPKYKVRYFNSGGTLRDTYIRSTEVRLPQSPVYDDYDPKVLFGSWKIGQAGAINKYETENGNTITKTTEYSYASSTDGFALDSRGVYVWKRSKTEVYRGRWVKNNDENNPAFPIRIKNAYKGRDWLVGPAGRTENGDIQLMVKDTELGAMWYGPRLSKPPKRVALYTPPGYVAPAPAPAGKSTFAVDDSVEVHWGVKWWPARVLAVENGKYKIRYDGFDSSWDEWVGPDRIRARQ